MILVDTSVWVDHLRVGEQGLVALLQDSLVLAHPFVIGELALGTLHNREQVLGLLSALPQTPVATHEETMQFIENFGLYGRGIGYVDSHLLAAARLQSDACLWTRDKRLQKVAVDLRMAMEEPKRLKG